jgi:hypothetical protein
MIQPDVRRTLEDLRQHFARLNGNCVTRDPSVIEDLGWECPPVSRAVNWADTQAQIDRVLRENERLPMVARVALERARRLTADLHGTTLVEANAIEKRPWFTNVTWLDFDKILDQIDAVIGTKNGVEH